MQVSRAALRRSRQLRAFGWGLRGVSLSSSLPNKEVPSSEALRRSRCCAGPNCPARPLLQMNPWKAGILLRGRQAFRLADLLSREGGTVGCSRRALGCGGSASERGEEMQDVAACSANLWLLAADSAGLLPVTWPCEPSRPCRGQWDRAGGVALAGGHPGHTDTQLSGKKKKKLPSSPRSPHPLPWKRRPAAFASLGRVLGRKLVAGPAGSLWAWEGPDGAPGLCQLPT